MQKPSLPRTTQFAWFYTTRKMSTKKRRLAVNELPVIPIMESDSDDYRSPVSDLDCEDISDHEPFSASLGDVSKRSKTRYSRVPLSATMRSFKHDSADLHPKSHKKVNFRLGASTMKDGHMSHHADGFTTHELLPASKPKRQKKDIGLPRHKIANLFPLQVRKGPHPDVEFLERPNVPPNEINDNVAQVEFPKRRQRSLDDEVIFAKLSTISAPARNVDSDTSEDEDDYREFTPSVVGDDDEFEVRCDGAGDDGNPLTEGVDVLKMDERAEDTTMSEIGQSNVRSESLSPPFSPLMQSSIDGLPSLKDVDILEPEVTLDEPWHLQARRSRQHSFWTVVHDDILDDGSEFPTPERYSKTIARDQAPLTSRRVPSGALPHQKPKIPSVKKSMVIDFDKKVYIPTRAPRAREKPAARSLLSSKHASIERQIIALLDQRAALGPKERISVGLGGSNNAACALMPAPRPRPQNRKTQPLLTSKRAPSNTQIMALIKAPPRAPKKRIVIDLDDVNNGAYFPMPAPRQTSRVIAKQPLLTSKRTPTNTQIVALLDPTTPAPRVTSFRHQSRPIPNTAGRYFEPAQEIQHHGLSGSVRTTTRFSSLLDIYEDPPSPTMEYPHLNDDHLELIPPPSGQGERKKAENASHGYDQDAYGSGKDAGVVRRSSLLLKPPFLGGW